MISEVKGKKVKIRVSLNSVINGIESITSCMGYYEGVVDNCSVLGGENFIIFEDGNMINMKYVQTIEIL